MGVLSLFWEDGQESKVPALPPDPFPNPQKKPERRGQRSAFPAKEAKGLGEKV
jgi:hypothetical protein